MNRWICIHGHFYQPPRENPWLEAIERQESAYPYHDWNARVTAECYAPNAASRILDDHRRVERIVNNYSRISFNFGPTLLSWLRVHADGVYRAIIEADAESMDRFSGHGSALAQAYNHSILPLASESDRRTQVRWGIEDFRHHFGRDPEGMWLPETAVDLSTLETLAEEGIRYTILAPHQAARVRAGEDEEWQDVEGGRIDPTRPYVQQLPSGRTIDLFFYDGPISRAVAFERLLASGERFAGRLASGFSEERDGPELVHIATDGETYGHHHRHGEMALSYALHHIEEEGIARLTNYGEFLELHPAEHQVEIFEDTSWSCAHGVERWRSDCGCSTGGEEDWNQAWRGPLRESLDWLREPLDDAYRNASSELLADPEEARDRYVEVVLNRSDETLDRYFEDHQARPLTPEERIRALELLELQRHAMLMYTSCGWFFNELSGIETAQVLQYAGRALQLHRDLFGEDLEPGFLERLERAPSNIPEWATGRGVYERTVRPAMVDLEKVGAHFAVSFPFEEYGEHPRIYCYTVDVLDEEIHRAGRSRLGIGRVMVRSDVTRRSKDLSFGVVHMGDHHVNGGVRDYQDDKAYRVLVTEVRNAYDRGDFPELVRLLDRHFGADNYSLRSLFRDQQQAVLERILEGTLADAEAAYRRLYQDRSPLMRYLTDMSVPVPDVLRRAAEWVLNTDLERALSEERPAPARIEALLEEAKNLEVPLDTAGLGYALTRALERLASRLAEEPQSLEHLDALSESSELARTLPFEVNVWTVQNIVYDLLQTTYPAYAGRAEDGDEEAKAWVARFASLGESLAVAIPVSDAAPARDLPSEAAEDSPLDRSRPRTQFPGTR